jgi:hypothetical protein
MNKLKCRRHRPLNQVENKLVFHSCDDCSHLGDFIVPLHGAEFAIQDCKIPRVKDGKYHNKYNPKCMKNRRGECRDWKAR